MKRPEQRGAALVAALVMLIAVLLVGIAAAQSALQGEKAARNDRDRQIALQAAEAALMDAELDIQGSPDAGNTRSALFTADNRLPFAEPGCQSGSANVYLGLCASADDATPAWQTVDITDTSGDAKSVSYGRFTGQKFQTGAGPLPAKLPRYIIEQSRYNKEGEAADAPTYFYRITAIGFGTHESTQVVLQTFYRKESN